MSKPEKHGSTSSILEDPEALPDLLFHYTHGDVAIEYILGSGRFRLSPRGRMNDPREFADRSFGMVGSGPLPKGTGGIYVKQLETQVELNEIIKEKVKLACFTADATQIGNAPGDVFRRGFAKSRMWSQYGEEHRGVCLVFSKTRFYRQVFALKKAPGDRLLEGRVSYEDLSTESIRASILDGDRLKDETPGGLPFFDSSAELFSSIFLSLSLNNVKTISFLER